MLSEPEIREAFRGSTCGRHTECACYTIDPKANGVCLHKENYLISLKYRQELVDTHPKQISYLVRLGRIHQNIGLTYGNLKNEVKKEEYYLKSIDIGKRVCQLVLDDPRLLSDLCRYQSGLSNLYVSQGRFDEALKLLDESWELVKTEYKESPGVIELGVAVIEVSVSLGELHQQQNAFEKAVEVFDSGIKVGLETFERANKNQAVLRHLLAGNLSRADCLFELGRNQEALQGKLAAIPFAVNPQREWVAKLEAKQLDFFLGSDDDVEEFIKSVPDDLTTSDERIVQELYRPRVGVSRGS